MGHREGRDLPQQRPEARGKEEQAQHEEDMVEAERHDMLEPRTDVAQEHRARAFGQDLRPRQGRGQLATRQKPLVGVIPAADLARDEGSPARGDADFHARIAGRKRRHHGQHRIPRQAQVACGRDLQVGDLGHQPFAVDEQQQTPRDPWPGIAQRGLQRLGLQRAQLVVDGGFGRVVGVVDRRQVDSGDQRLKRDAQRKGHLLGADLDIRDGRANLVRRG
jgi:hypothetical protein